MTLPNDSSEPTVTHTHNEVEIENKDSSAVTPPRKGPHKTQTTTPATPKSKANTPLHKRFLEEVTMTPGTPSTPPRTPSRSPKTGGKEKGTLEVGQNGFYFSMEIPERKIVESRPTSRAATPSPEKRSVIKDIGRLTPSRLTPSRLANGRTTPGGLSPSPKKDTKSEVKGTPTGGGRVRDILRKNLFGTPAKKATKPGWGDTKNGGDVRMSPVKHNKDQSQTSGGSESESTRTEAATADATTLFFTQKPGSFAPPPAQPSCSLAPRTTQKSDMTVDQCQTPMTMPFTPAPVTDTAPSIDLERARAPSTPSNIGHLMANYSNNKSAKVQPLPITSGLESMPTPLRKMQEKLGLRSPHVVRREKNDGQEPKDLITKPETGTMISPISELTFKDAAAVKDMSSRSAQAHDLAATITTGALGGTHASQKEDRLARLLPSPITTTLPVTSSRPHTATTPSFPSPLTPSRPGLSSRSKSFGTPARLRSSMQEDMFKVQESLRRSLGQEAFQKTISRPATPISPSVEASRPSTSTTNHSKSSVKTVTRPVSVVGSPQPSATSTAQAVPRRPLTTAARKPRPKSMIVGSAKILETVALQTDSPRERAKLRSMAAAPTNQRSKSVVSRPGQASSTLRASKPAGTAQKPEKPVSAQPTVRTTKPAAPRAAAPPKRAALPAATAVSVPVRQRVVSAEVIADRIAAWNQEDNASTAPRPVSKAAAKLPVRSKSVKTLNKPTVKQPRAHTKTPEPKTPTPTPSTAHSFTPPGNPTRLPMSPSKKLLIAPPSAAAHLRTRTPLPAKTPAHKRHTWIEGGAERDPNALRTPSREMQSALDAAIDRKIEEDRRRAGWI